MDRFVPIQGLHHWAYRCRDAEETRHFYEDLLGLPLTHFIRQDAYVGTSGERVDCFAHIFFEMADGSSLAFFDLGDDVTAEPSQYGFVTTWPSRWSRSIICSARTSVCRRRASTSSARSITTAG